MKKQLFAYAMGVLSLGLLASCSNNLDEDSLDPGKNGTISMKLASAPEVNIWSGSEVLAGEKLETRAEGEEVVNQKYLNDEVEVNLSINDVHKLAGSNVQKYDVADLVSKLSIHIRSGKDVKVVIPVGKEYYCDQDDMYIFNTHGGEIFANGGQLANNTASVKVSFKGKKTETPEVPECSEEGNCCGGKTDEGCNEPNDDCENEGDCCCSPKDTPEHDTCEHECEEAQRSADGRINCYCQNLQDGLEEDPINYQKYCKCNGSYSNDPENPEGPSTYSSRAEEEVEGDEEVTYEVTVYIQFNDEDITVWTEGVTEEAIDALKAAYGDGLNIEVYNYYNRAKAEDAENYAEYTLSQLKEALDQSTVEFSVDGENSAPDYYINAFTGDVTNLTVGETEEEVYRDCYVTPVNWSTYFNAPYFDYHFNGFDKNLIYVNSSVENGKVGEVVPETDQTFRTVE